MYVLHLTLIAAIAAAAIAGARAQVAGTEAPRVITYIEVMPASADTAIGILRRGAAARRGALAILEAWSDPKALAAHDDGAAAKVLRSELNPIRIGYYDQRLETAIDTGTAAGETGKDSIYVATHVDVTGQFKDDAIV